MKTFWLCLACSGVALGQNLLCNGGFELPQVTTNSAQIELPCWRTDGGQKMEVQRRAGNFVDGVIGNQYVELDVNSNSDIYQDIPTVVGQRYLVHVWVANRFDSVSSAFQFTWDGNLFATVQRSGEDLTFTRFSAEVVATKTVSRLSILAAGPSDSVGDLLDEVSVLPIASPGSRLGYTYYIPHYADGGGWASSLLLANTSPFFSATVEYTVLADNGTELDSRVNGTLILNVLGSTVIESPRPATLRTGWVRVASSEPLRASVIFRSILPGRFDLEATVLARELTTETVAPFDNTTFVTGFAAVNPNSFPITLTFSFRDAAGLVISTNFLSLAPGAHTSFAFGDQFASSRDRKGAVQIRATNGAGNPVDFLPLGLRFAPGGIFTTLPY